MPITITNRHRSDNAGGSPARHGVVEAALRDKRAAGGRAERSLQEALATIRDLQTKLGHAELARREASGTAEVARAAADASRAERTRVSALAAQPTLDLQDAPPASVAKAPAKPVAKRTRKSAAEPRQREPQPVKWWLKSARKRWPSPRASTRLHAGAGHGFRLSSRMLLNGAPGRPRGIAACDGAMLVHPLGRQVAGSTAGGVGADLVLRLQRDPALGIRTMVDPRRTAVRGQADVGLVVTTVPKVPI